MAGNMEGEIHTERGGGWQALTAALSAGTQPPSWENSEIALGMTGQRCWGDRPGRSGRAFVPIHIRTPASKHHPPVAGRCNCNPGRELRFLLVSFLEGVLYLVSHHNRMRSLVIWRNFKIELLLEATWMAA